MSTNLGSLVVNLSANIAEFNRNMDLASQRTEQAAARMSAAADRVKNVLGAVGVALSVDLIVSEVNRSLDALAALDDMAQKTGSSVETLSKLSKVAAFTGTDLGAVDSMLVKLSKNLATMDDESNKAAKAFAAIGISTDDIKDKDPAQLFVDITNKLQDYEDGAGKVALVTDLMGKSAADLLPYMNDVSESIDKFAGDSAEAAAQAAAFQDQLGLMRVKYDELQTSIVVAALPAATAFLDVLMDTKREAGLLAKDNSMSTWADNTAIVLARVVDRAKLVSSTLGVVGSSLRGLGKEAQVVASLNPVVMAYTKLEGGDPMAEYMKASAESDKVWADVSRKIDAFSNMSLTATEEATIRAIADQKNARGLAILGGMAGLNDIGGGKTLKYGETKPTPTKGGKAVPAAPVIDVPAAVARMRDLGPDPAIAERMFQLMNDQTGAMRNTIDTTLELMEAEQKRWDQQARAMQQNEANVEQIRLSLMTEVEHEQMAYDLRVEQLRVFGENKLGSEMATNAMIEQETARHARAVADIETGLQMQKLAMIGNSTDQLYSLLEKAGLEQTALAKGIFLASKAIAVAEIIMNTNVAASKAEAQFGAWGVPIATAIKVAGYASAGMTAGLAIAQASAEGGYDIPAGVNPVTQLHEREMVLPKRQADVIRGLADGSAFGGNRGTVNVTYSPQIQIDGSTDMEKNRKMISMAVQQGNADLVDRLQRAGRI